MNKTEVKKVKSGDEKRPVVSFPGLLDPVSAVNAIVTKALETSARKIGVTDSEACLERLKKYESVAFNYYCYNVAKELGEVLGSWSKNIKSVFACCYDEDVNGEECCEKLLSFSLIHLIIMVEKKSKALDALIDAVDSALVQRHWQMLGHKQMEHALDARIIDDEDVKNRTGYAALLRSVYRPPIQVWQSSFDI